MEEKLTTVATYPQSAMAHMAKNFLIDNGIHAVLADEYLTNQVWVNFFEAKVQVPAEDAERASALLKNIKQA
jgi:Putative prokaryotic signal transducing protein